MKEIVTDVAIVGAGSAGLSAAYQAACAGADVLVIDENSRPGGQLFKQIHKFFGSKGIRQEQEALSSASSFWKK